MRDLIKKIKKSHFVCFRVTPCLAAHGEILTRLWLFRVIASQQFSLIHEKFFAGGELNLEKLRDTST